MSSERAIEYVQGASLLMEAGAEIDRLKWKTRNQRKELARLNRLVHEHTSRAMSAGTKAQRRAIQVSQLEQENERLKRDYAKVVSLLQAYGVPNVQSC
jgi:hypothetical protein